MSELKPCPFCGSRDIGVGMNITNCYKCGIEIGPFSSPEEAISKWNNRPAERKILAEGMQMVLDACVLDDDASSHVYGMIEDMEQY